jgi:hypothetical protein
MEIAQEAKTGTAGTKLLWSVAGYTRKGQIAIPVTGREGP